MRWLPALWLTATLLLTLAGCRGKEAAPMPLSSAASLAENGSTKSVSARQEIPMQTGLIAEQILSGAEGDEYYGSDKARLAYENLHAAYESAGWSDADIDRVLRLEIPDNAFFNEKGIYNYHGGANVLFDNPDNLNWIISHTKG